MAILRSHLQRSRRKWLRSERCLVCHRLAPFSFDVSNIGRQAWDSSALVPTCGSGYVGQCPPSHSRPRPPSRSHSSRVAPPKKLTAKVKAALRARFQKFRQSPAGPLATGRLRGPTSRVALLMKDHIPLTRRIFQSEVQALNCLAPVPQVND